ncbi:MAG TPA: glutamate-cysteine ligase family protein [Haloplasmataceae bacterium]
MKTEQINDIVEYIKSHEKSPSDFLVGSEFEYFVCEKDTLEAVSYFGNDGVESTLKELLNKGYEGIYENNHLLGLKNTEATITLEPGSQLEISVIPSRSISDIEKIYKTVCLDVLEVLERKKQVLLATGYRVNTKIDEINLIPKKRYHYMYEYFKKCGKFAHNMMKQTASTQVSIDYANEDDYYQKYRILNTLSPIFYAFFDNSPYFEKEIYNKHGIRSQIWDNCDDKRCGIMDKAITNKFIYEDYAKYLLNQEIIFLNDSYEPHTKLTDIYYINKKDYLEHALSMVFPDIRTRKYIEIRVFDALPYPLNIALVTFIKGLFYSQDNMALLFAFVNQFSINDVYQTKKQLIDLGNNVKLKDYSVFDIMNYLMDLSEKNLSKNEVNKLRPLKGLLKAKICPKHITFDLLHKGQKEALEWCILTPKYLLEEELWMQEVLMKPILI